MLLFYDSSDKSISLNFHEFFLIESSIKACLSCDQGNDSVLELFTVLSEEEVQRKMNKKMKKAKKKAAK